MTTGKQVRAARMLVEWDAEDLAAKTGLTRESIFNIERGIFRPRPATLEKIIRAFSGAGVEFIGERGVAKRDDQIVTLTGENIFFRLLDDVIATLGGEPDAEALFACVDDSLSPPVVVENYRRLRKSKIAMRSLVKEGNTRLMGKLDEYRYLPKDHYHNSATIIYGNKFATMILDETTGADDAAVIINNPHIAAAQRNLFNLIWTHSNKPTKSTSEVKYDE